VTTADQVPAPAPGTAMTPGYVEAVGRLAYLWGWPLVSMLNRRVALTSVPEPGLRGGVLPNAPAGQVCMMTDYIPADQRFVACTNQDVAYGMGFGKLDEEPAVLQVPEFGDRFWVAAAWDARGDSFADVGKQYGSPPGFYLMIGPNWDGQVPGGITKVFRSPTELAAFCPRVFLNDTDEDRAAIQPILNQVMVYPLSQFDGTMKTKDWKAVPVYPVPEGAGAAEIRWVDPAAFFDQLPGVLAAIPPLPGEEALYALIGSVLDAARTNPDIKQALTTVAAAAEQELISPLLQWRLNGPPAGNGWYSPVNNAKFGTDYLTRTAIARSNMFENTPEETKYVFTDNDTAGQPLDGHHLYAITFAAGELPPVNGFWSLTLYNEFHFYNPNPLGRYSLGTKNKTLHFNDDGSLTLYAGAASPGPDHEPNWLPAPQGPFSLYIRGYWAKQPMIDHTWQPPTIARTQP
jgi:hypothetical protein